MAEGTVAFADEGVRAGANPPLYLIAATVVPAKAALSPLESMLPKGATKLHWRDMGPRAQRQSLACIAQLGTRSTVVAASPIDPRRQERARRKDLEALLPLLEAQGVTTLVMESRFPAADAKDASHFQTMVRRGLVSSIELHFADPAVEHRLWIPDQILGAYAESAASYSGSSPHQQPSPTSARSGGTASSWAARRQPSRWGSGTCTPTLAGCTRRASYAPSFPACRDAVRRVDERDVTFRFGTPVTRAERTILDLALDGEDPSLVADVLADAERRLSRADFDHARLAELFAGSVGRWGVPAGTLEALAAEAGVDVTPMEIGGQA